MLGRMLGQYELQDQLGAPSGMGSVYVAIDTVLNREVAIKELLPHLSRDREFAMRFRAEAENHARLSHPNITTLYSLGQEGESEFMVMELVRGYTLKDIMARTRLLSPRECLAVVAQAAAGLSYAHRMGVIHRDIKPSNIMITHDGLLKIMDFGISRVRGSQRQTRDGGIVGTLLYISPEQLRSAEGDERSDIYSLAVMLYEMLTGHPPFKADNEYDLMRLHLETPPEPLSALLPTIDPHIEAAVLRALEKNPDDRFSSIEEFSRSIGAAAVRGESIEILRQCLNKAYDTEATVIYHSLPTRSGEAPRPSALRSASRPAPSAASGRAPVAEATAVPARAPEPRRGLPTMVLGISLVLVGIGVGYFFLVPKADTVRPPGAADTPPRNNMAALPAPQPSQPVVPPPVPASPTPAPPVPAPPIAAPAPQVTLAPASTPQSVVPPAPAATSQQAIAAVPAIPAAPAVSPAVPPATPAPETVPPVGQQASLPQTPLPPARPVEQPAVEGIISSAAGAHALVIGGKFVTLFGVEPNSPNPTQFNQDRLAFEKLVRGTKATCYQRPQNRFFCTDQNGEDLAVVALRAGLVRPTRNAPSEYRSFN